MQIKPYLELIRFYKPAGTFLLFWPCLWGIIIASPSIPRLTIIILFVLGAFLMRSAGCIINDIIDKDIDKKVERTKNRPLASGVLTIKQALKALAILLGLSFVILLQFNWLTIILGCLVLIPVAAYPYMKRITHLPQLFLGFTFNFGVILASTAVTGSISFSIILLYIAAITWTLGYDTIYGQQDMEDDQRIGVKSTALLWKNDLKRWLYSCYGVTSFCLFAIGWINNMNILFYFAWMLISLHLYWQIKEVRLNNSAHCMQIFNYNLVLGGIIALGLFVGGF